MKINYLIVSGLVPLITMATQAAAFEPIISMPGEHVTIHPAVLTDVVPTTIQSSVQAEALRPAGATDEILATREQTGGQFSVLTLGTKAGDGPGPAIVHANEAEAWYVPEGTFEFHVGDQVFEGGPGTFIAVNAGQPHGYITETDGRILAMFSPGGYEQFFVDWAAQGLVPGPELGALEQSYGVTRP